MSSSPNFTFTWPAGPEEVILTGTFDDWKGSLPLVKTSSGSFEITLPLPKPQQPDDDDKIYFKFIVDGDWTVSDDYDKESDGCGFENNFIDVTKETSTRSVGNETRIPEAGGLSMSLPTNTEKEITSPTATNNQIDNNTNDGTFHILPVVEPQPTDDENNKNRSTGFIDNIGGPGPVIPENAQNIKEFSEIRDVDAKELNERLNKELRTKKELDKSTEPTSSTVSHSGSTQPEVKDIGKEKFSNEIIDKNNDIQSEKEHDVEKSPLEQEKSGIQSEDEENAFEAEIPVIQTEETKHYNRAPEPLPESIKGKKTSIPTTKEINDDAQPEQKEAKASVPAKSPSKPTTKAKEETKKPKKGLFGKLKKMFT